MTTTKRYFEFTDGDGADYYIVATDEQAAIKALDDVEFGDPSEPFDKAVDADGQPLKMTEVDAAAAAKIMVNTDEEGRGNIQLTECNLGEWFSSEY